MLRVRVFSYRISSMKQHSGHFDKNQYSRKVKIHFRIYHFLGSVPDRPHTRANGKDHTRFVVAVTRPRHVKSAVSAVKLVPQSQQNAV